MSCCGQKREALRTAVQTNNKNTSERQPAFEHTRPNFLFRYEGLGVVTYTGAVTRKSYRFSFKGETRIVDYRDAGALLAEPLLRQIVQH